MIVTWHTSSVKTLADALQKSVVIGVTSQGSSGGMAVALANNVLGTRFQPVTGYLGSQDQFSDTYEPRGENADSAQRIARRRLAAKLRPLLMRRLKRHVAKDLPEYLRAQESSRI